jgi:cation-transporting ATPase 13A3/4/5
MTPKQILMEAMASCHGLARVNNKLIGDPLEVKMFEATNFILDDINSKVIGPNETIQILRRFEFSSTLQRMSVIVEKDGVLRVHVKGSPEKLRELCKSTTIPSSFHKILEFYSKLGFRILACGTKILPKE